MSRSSTLLLDAIERNDADVASSLIASGDVSVNSSPTPLLRACERGCVAIVSMLLDAGASVNSINENRQSACHVAIRHGQFAALELLVRRGANLCALDSLNNSLLMYATYQRDERIALVLLDAGASIDDLDAEPMMNLATKSVNVLARLLSRNVDLASLRDTSGRSLFHRLMLGSSERTASDLAELGRAFVAARVDVNAANVWGETALHNASASRHFAAVRLLVELGADVDAQMRDGTTPVHNLSADRAKSVPCLELLLAVGANARLATKQGESPSHWAARTPLTAAALCTLLAAGGDLEQPNKSGETPRMLISFQNRNVPTDAEIADARQRIAKSRLDLVRHRALDVCIGMQPLNLDALQLCEIMMLSCGVFGGLIAFHHWWKIATTVKHFQQRKIKIE